MVSYRLLQVSDIVLVIIVNMGELLKSSETILFTLPWPKRPELIEHLQKKFPDAEVIYEFVEWKRSKSGDRPAQVPDGKSHGRSMLWHVLQPQAPTAEHIVMRYKGKMT